jgi:lipoate-protein ligase A
MTRAFRKGFEKTWDCRMETSTVRENELQMARRLARDKYGSDLWNLRR